MFIIINFRLYLVLLCVLATAKKPRKAHAAQLNTQASKSAHATAEKYNKSARATAEKKIRAHAQQIFHKVSRANFKPKLANFSKERSRISDKIQLNFKQKSPISSKNSRISSKNSPIQNKPSKVSAIEKPNFNRKQPNFNPKQLNPRKKWTQFG